MLSQFLIYGVLTAIFTQHTQCQGLNSDFVQLKPGSDGSDLERRSSHQIDKYQQLQQAISKQQLDLQRQTQKMQQQEIIQQEQQQELARLKSQNAVLTGHQEHHQQTISMLESQNADLTAQLKTATEEIQQVKSEISVQKIGEIVAAFQRPPEEMIQSAAAFFQQNGRADIATILLDNEGDVNKRDSNGKAPLHLASEKGRADAVKVLLDRGANIDIKDTSQDDFTPLHWASEKGNVEVVKVLIEKGALLDAKQNGIYNWTPLHYASFWGLLEVVKLLTDNGASVNVRDAVNRTPLTLANRYTATVEYLRSRGGTS